MASIPYTSIEIRKSPVLLLSLALTLVLVFILLNSRLNLIEINSKSAIRKQNYFHLYLREKVSEIRPLEGESIYLGGVNLTLHDALLRIQNDYYDSILVDHSGEYVSVRIAIPDNVEDKDIQEYINYQSLNYVLVLSKLLPENRFKVIGLNAFRRGDYSNEFHDQYEFRGLLSLRTSTYNNYKISNYRQKKAA